MKCHNCHNGKSSLHTTGLRSAWKDDSLSSQNDSSQVNSSQNDSSRVNSSQNDSSRVNSRSAGFRRRDNSVVLPKTADCSQRAKPCFDGQLSIETLNLFANKFRYSENSLKQNPVTLDQA